MGAALLQVARPGQAVSVSQCVSLCVSALLCCAFLLLSVLPSCALSPLRGTAGWALGNPSYSLPGPDVGTKGSPISSERRGAPASARPPNQYLVHSCSSVCRVSSAILQISVSSLQ